MTLQEIADYAMDYLDSKGIAADYDVFDDHIVVYFKDVSCAFVCNATKLSVEGWIDSLINHVSID